MELVEKIEEASSNIGDSLKENAEWLDVKLGERLDSMEHALNQVNDGVDEVQNKVGKVVQFVS